MTRIFLECLAALTLIASAIVALVMIFAVMP